MKIFITGDLPKDPKERSIIIMNHRTRQDWLLFWAVLHRYFNCKNSKIILRGDLKHFPGFGKIFSNWLPFSSMTDTTIIHYKK